jgi:hypothetical protein
MDPKLQLYEKRRVDRCRQAFASTWMPCNQWWHGMGFMDPSYVGIYPNSNPKLNCLPFFILATVFESILFLFVAYSGAVSIAARIRVNERISLTTVLINENCLYFFRYVVRPFYILIFKALIPGQRLLSAHF